MELGQQVMLQVNFSGTGTGQNYQWRKAGSDIAGATAISYVLPAATPADAGTYAVTVTNAGGSSVATTEVAVRPAAPPVITTPPRATVVQVGQTVTFSFAASGSYPRTHQWRKDGADIAGGTNATLPLTNITTADAGVYAVVVGNSLGSVTSASASLTVNAATPPVLSNFSPSDSTYTQGQSVSLSASINSGSSPFTYQWLKAGAPIAGATGAQLTFTSIAVADAGRYSVTVTNIVGSATSREAVITVNAATPITIGRAPESVTIAQGQQASFSVSLSNGSSPLTYQWLKNGAPITGATNSSYSIARATTADAGSFAVTITNAAGPVTSASATLTVTPAVAPTITTQPVAQTVGFNSSFSLSVQVSGTSPFTYQWLKDGVAITGATSSSYFQSSATPANSGTYSVVVTNGAGNVTSNAAIITVNTAAVPTISTQPVDRQVAAGLSTSFSVSVSSSGTGNLTFQWLKNGGPISGATSSSLSFNQLRDTDAGDYSVVITGAGGTVRSDTARLIVLPPAPPTFSSSNSGRSAALGDSASFSVSMNGSGPFTYQWMREGVPITGATSSSYSIARVTEADYASYYVVVANDGGVVVSTPARLTRSTSSGNPTPPPWVSARQLGTTIYFLATSPGRIERYDMAIEQWLPTVILSETQVPTAFLPTNEGVYIAYGRALVRRGSDLAADTPITNTVANITVLFAVDDFLYYNTTSSASSSSTTALASIRRSTLAAGPTSAFAFSDAVVAPTGRRVFGTTSNSFSQGAPQGATAGSDGRLTAITPVATGGLYFYSLPGGTTVFVTPAEDLVISSGGTIYRAADLGFAGSLGTAVNDLTFFADNVPVALRDRTLHLLGGGNFLESGRASLGFTATRVFAHAGNVFAFGAATAAGSRFNVSRVARSTFTSNPPVTVTLNAGERFSIDGIYAGADGVVGIFSRSKQAVLRWSTVSRSYLSPIALRGQPLFAAQTQGATRALFCYDDGTITEVPLRTSATAERPVAAIGNRVWAMTDLGDFIMINARNYSDSGDFRTVLNSQGQTVSISQGSIYNGAGMAWSPPTRRLYSTDPFSSASLRYETIPASGALPSGSSTGNTGATVSAPLRFNPEYTLIATGNGRVLNADLAQVGALANNVIDAAWLPGGLYTLRVGLTGEAEVQRWTRVTYLQSGSASVRGTPLRIFALSDSQLVIVTSVQGFVSYSFVDSNLSVTAPPGVLVPGGVYFARISNPAGDLALYVRADGTAVLVAQIEGTRAALVAANVTLNADGTFVASARDLATGASRTIAGAVGADGSLAGSIASLNAGFTGSRTSGGQSGTGYYQASATNGAVGAAYAIVAADGRALVVAQTGTTVDGGVGTLDAASRVSLPLNSGARFDVTINVGIGSLAATADRGTFSGTVFAGLREGVARTDRLANISTRGRVGSGADAIIAGFVISGNAPRTVLVRAIGPALGNFGLVGALADPRLTLFRGGTQLMVSDDWSAESPASAIVAVTPRLGAFGLPNPGKDAVLFTTLEPGGYTAQVTPATGGGGVALVEVYDAGENDASGSPRLINIATRGRVGLADDVLIAGIVVTGNAPKRLLIRAVGPTLTTFGVSDALADPVLSLLSGSRTLATNDDWSVSGASVSASDVSTAAVSVGAFALPSSSRDASLLITLEPGNYTAQVSGKGSATGVALVEVYEVNN